MAIKVYVSIAIVVAVLAIGGGIYWAIYNKGKTAVYIEQEKKLNTLKDKTHDVQNDALTNPVPRDSLRKYSRPD
jgi:uncharacterized protein YxeA